MSEKLKAIIIDDETLAIEGLIDNIAKIKYIELVGTCENTMDALEILNEQTVDLLFLDIQMPKISGITFLKNLKNKPLTIISSAFPEYALEGYELDIIDYLVKPFSFERFLKACTKAKEHFDLKKQLNLVEPSQDFVFIKCEKKIEKLFFDEILFIEGLKNYIAIHTVTKKYISHLTLKSIEDNLPLDRFIKVHKSFIVSVSKITSIYHESVFIDTFEIPISRSNKEYITKFILNNKYLKK